MVQDCCLCGGADDSAGQCRPRSGPWSRLRTWDISLAKDIKVHEDIRFQFRAETFNIFNHTNFLTVNTTRTSTQFGQVTAFRDPRLIQFGLKFYFLN